MKKKILLLLLCLLCPLLILPSGCSTNKPTAEAVAYQTLKTTWSAVDAAMQVYGVAIRAGKVSASDEIKIDAAHEKFRLAFISAAKIAKQDWSQITPDNVASLQAELLQLIAKLN